MQNTFKNAYECELINPSKSSSKAGTHPHQRPVRNDRSSAGRASKTIPSKWAQLSMFHYKNQIAFVPHSLALCPNCTNNAHSGFQPNIQRTTPTSSNQQINTQFFDNPWKNFVWKQFSESTSVDLRSKQALWKLLGREIVEERIGEALVDNWSNKRTTRKKPLYFDGIAPLALWWVTNLFGQTNSYNSMHCCNVVFRCRKETKNKPSKKPWKYAVPKMSN